MLVILLIIVPVQRMEDKRVPHRQNGPQQRATVKPINNDKEVMVSGHEPVINKSKRDGKDTKVQHEKLPAFHKVAHSTNQHQEKKNQEAKLVK